MATHSGLLAWRIPWTEEPGGLQSMGLQRVEHGWATKQALTTLPGRDTLWCKSLQFLWCLQSVFIPTRVCVLTEPGTGCFHFLFLFTQCHLWCRDGKFDFLPPLEQMRNLVSLGGISTWHHLRMLLKLTITLKSLLWWSYVLKPEFSNKKCFSF